MAEKLSSAQQQAIDWIQAKKAADYGALGIEVGKILADLAVELADAKQEAAHWKQSFETVHDELKVMVSVAIHKSGGSRLTVSKNEYLAVVKGNVELYCGAPQDGTRIYELRRRTKKNPINEVVKEALNGRIIQPH